MSSLLSHYHISIQFVDVQNFLFLKFVWLTHRTINIRNTLSIFLMCIIFKVASLKVITQWKVLLHKLESRHHNIQLEGRQIKKQSRQKRSWSNYFTFPLSIHTNCFTIHREVQDILINNQVFACCFRR